MNRKMFKWLWLILVITIDFGVFIYIFKELPYAIKNKEVKDFLEGDAGEYIGFHLGLIILVSFLYWIISWR